VTKAAYQGEPGAFSEDAARTILGAGVETVPQKTFEEMFDTVTKGRADCAIVPIENTLAGSVIKNHDLLLEHDLTIIGEVVSRVVHNLIGHAGTKLEDIRRVYSHPVALAQCERFLHAHPQFEVVSAYDTAGSVKMVMEGGRRDEAGIAGASAAPRYGAAILAAGIESNPQNFTRFFVVVRPDRAGSVPILAKTSERKTSIVYFIANLPGGLYKSLAAFAEENIDLTKIESRPIEGRPWEYSFYLDFLGDRADPPVQRALARMTSIADKVRILGSYPRGSV
jgi:prephenate dehydratase